LISPFGSAPRIFNLAFAIIRPFLNEATANKIRIVGGSGASQWAKTLLEEIDAEHLPVHYGGSMTDPDGNPNCITKVEPDGASTPHSDFLTEFHFVFQVNLGGLVPESYYFKKREGIDNKDKKSLVVSYGAREKLEVDVKVPGSSIRWEFYSEEGDIAFSVYQRCKGVKIPVVPKDRVDSHIAAEEGEIRVDPGQYVVEFDNSYSYLRSKTIWYAVWVDSFGDKRTSA